MPKEEQKPLNIYKRILAVMKDVDYIQKGDKKVNNQYRYVSHDQVSAVIHPKLVEHGIVIIPTVKTMTQDGNRTTMWLQVLVINADLPEDCFVIDTWGYGIDQGDKGPGKAISYAYKYALLKLFCLETGDDPDHDQDAKYEAPQPVVTENSTTEELISPEDAYNLERDIQLLIAPYDPEYRKRALSHYKKDSFEEISINALPRLKANVRNKVKQLKTQEGIEE